MNWFDGAVYTERMSGQTHACVLGFYLIAESSAKQLLNCMLLASSK
jgi:hypothetical protein